MASLPSRGRGLKFIVSDNSDSVPDVAPFTGAWIEIRVFRQFGVYTDVAPFTGAWIEISEFKSDSKSKESLPSRGRGLKFGTDISVHEIDPVAPFTGAWIEISYWKVAKNVKLGSLPSRGRGLKF